METTLTKEKSPVPSTLKGLTMYPPIKEKFKELLGEKKAAGFMSSIISATEMNPKLRECPPMNLIAQAAVAASLDLPINPSLAFAHLVPYKGKAQFQMGWRGYVQLAQRSGEYATMNASDVYEDELEVYNAITGEFKTTDPKTWKQRETGVPKIAGYVAHFKLLSGFEKYLYWTLDQCLAHGKRYSKAFQRNEGPWVDNLPAMCLKTVTKLLISKWGPMSIEMTRAVNVDQAIVHRDLLAYEDPEKLEYPDAPFPADASTEPPGKIEVPETVSTTEKSLSERWATCQTEAKKHNVKLSEVLKNAEVKEIKNDNIQDVEEMLYKMIEQSIAVEDAKDLAAKK